MARAMISAAGRNIRAATSKAVNRIRATRVVSRTRAESQGAGGQDRERHTGDREHHPSGREQGRRGANGAQAGNRERDDQGQAEATHQGDEPAPDRAS